ncbi:MAG: 2-C-methyl-D-erythritol 2,4-cyclodiphosphate synthase, partial [Methylococcales bacterium]|nr:2-C-methyl-D-erythritol 2,4-cyclodiphosphate synthase [Methylococcales bacterium]
MIRVGQGYDVHRFNDEGEVILGGVTIDYEKG